MLHRHNVGNKLDYLVIGDGDFVLFADGHRTGKLDKRWSCTSRSTDRDQPRPLGER